MIKSFFVSLVSFAVLDFLWLGFVMRDTNMRLLSEIGRIENGEFQLLFLPAIIVYFLMAAGLVYFVLPRIDKATPLWKVFAIGGLMGFVVYGVYDFTNLAILKNYPIAFALPDILWGIFVYGTVTSITHRAAKTIRK